MSKRNWCHKSGHAIEAEPYSKATCPGCGKAIKVCFADGGYDGYARYTYIPHHVPKKDRA